MLCKLCVLQHIIDITLTVGQPYEHSYAIMIFLITVVITAISAFGIIKYFEYKRNRKYGK